MENHDEILSMEVSNMVKPCLFKIQVCDQQEEIFGKDIQNERNKVNFSDPLIF